MNGNSNICNPVTCPFCPDNICYYDCPSGYGFCIFTDPIPKSQGVSRDEKAHKINSVPNRNRPKMGQKGRIL